MCAISQNSDVIAKNGFQILKEEAKIYKNHLIASKQLTKSFYLQTGVMNLPGVVVFNLTVVIGPLSPAINKDIKCSLTYKSLN